jgi:hypothetical protein
MVIGQGISKTITLGWNKSVTGLEQDDYRPPGFGAKILHGWNNMVAGMEQDGYRAGARVFLG